MLEKIVTSLELLAKAGAKIVSAQNPTLDKLRFDFIGAGDREDILAVYPADNEISGNVIIPAEWEGKPVECIFNNAFENCTEITGITIPESIWQIGIYAFTGCTNLTSIIFKRNDTHVADPNYSFDGNLRNKYTARDGGAGTYTRSIGSKSWTKSPENDPTESAAETIRTVLNDVLDTWKQR